MARGYKTGGRRPGSPNKVTKDLRLLLKELIERELSNIDELMETVEPKDRLQFIIKLLPYTLPRYGNIEEEEPKKDEGWNEYVMAAIRKANKKGPVHINNEQSKTAEASHASPLNH